MTKSQHKIIIDEIEAVKARLEAMYETNDYGSVGIDIMHLYNSIEFVETQIDKIDTTG